MMAIEILAGKVSSSSWPYRHCLHASETAVTNTKPAVSGCQGRRKQSYGHHLWTIIFLGAWGILKTVIKLSELHSFIILLVINVKAIMKVSLSARLILQLAYFFFFQWVEAPPRGHFPTFTPLGPGSSWHRGEEDRIYKNENTVCFWLLTFSPTNSLIGISIKVSFANVNLLRNMS